MFHQFSEQILVDYSVNQVACSQSRARGEISVIGGIDGDSVRAVL